MVPLISTTSMNRNNIGKNPLSSIVYRAETIKNRYNGKKNKKFFFVVVAHIYPQFRLKVKTDRKL